MKIFILRNASVNRLLDKELEKLMNAKVEFAITNNNGRFEIDNTSGYAANMNTLIFIWEDFHDKNGNIVAEVIKPIFKFYSESNTNYMDEWKHLKNVLNNINSGSTIIYDISRGMFI